MSKAINNITSDRRKMARRPTSYATTWWARTSLLSDDMEAAKALVQMHEERVKLAHKFDTMDMRTYAAKQVVRQLNALTKEITILTKQLGAGA